MKKSITLATLLAATLTMSAAHASWLNDLVGSSSADTATSNQSAVTSGLSTNPLVNSLSSLGLNAAQTEGGIGSLLNVAKSTLGASDFSALSQSIPGADSLLAAAPALGGNDGLTSLLSKAGNVGQGLQAGAMVYDSFEKLGIPKDMVVPMINGVKSYLESQGDTGALGLLNKGLESLL
ncbi:MAG: DUF2780 domain-containing protein [Shewanella sp.]